MHRPTSGVWVVAALAVVLVAFAAWIQGCVYISGKGLLGMEQGPLHENRISGTGKDKILVVEISGLITEQEKGGLFSLQKEPSMVSSVKEQLDKAGSDSRIKGLLLLIDSPGGTVTASDLIYHELQKFKSAKPVHVVAYFMGTAASGGYYVAQVADRIVASPTTITGSIGVILMNLNLSGLMEKIGVSDTSVKSGRFKDVGSPFKKPEKEGEAILQGVVQAFYDRFCEVVETNRPKIKLADHPELADGRIFSAAQALEAGLVDEVGYFAAALEWVKKAAGLTEAQVIRYTRAGRYLPNIYSLATGAHGGFRGDINLVKLDLQSFLSASGPTFMYLWMPGL